MATKPMPPVGATLQAMYGDGGKFYPAEVLQVSDSAKRKKAPVKVRYEGFGPESDTWLSLDEIKPLKRKGEPKASAKASAKAADGASGLSKGMTVQAQYSGDGVYYAAEIVTVSTGKKRAKAPVLVHYKGQSEDSDEWLALDKIKSKALKGKAAEAAPKAAAGAAAGATDYSGLEKGMRVQAEYSGSWYAAEVVAIKKKSKTPVKVHYVGQGDDTDEWLGADRLRSKAIKKGAAPKAAAAAPAAAGAADVSGLEKGMRLQAEYDGVWYSAEVVAVGGKKHAKAPVKVHYIGQGDETDEWLPVDRLKSKAIQKTAPKAAAKAKGKAKAKGAAAAPAGKADVSGLEKGMRLQAQFSDGQWYAAEVVAVKKKGAAPVKVHYAGQGAETDEWLSADKLRSKAIIRK